MKKFVTALVLFLPLLCNARATAEWRDIYGRTVAGMEYSHQVWKGERINVSAVFKADVPYRDLTLEPGTFRCGKSCIPPEAVRASFISEVIGDELTDRYNQCGSRDTLNFKSISVPDLIGAVSSEDVEAGGTVHVWLSIDIPEDAVSGRYRGTLTFFSEGKKTVSLPYSFKVVDRILPPLKESPFHLDLWQNPYAVARYYDVSLWSKEHFDHLRPVMELLSDAGQKVITATIMNRPWDGQTEDPFGPMVTRILRADGSWLYDYTVFDRWVEFMMSLGIGDQINCYTMIPWSLTFDYFDQASNSTAYVQAAPGSEEYEAYWAPFIRDFADHLRSRGWFEKTCIAMDERPEESMQAAIRLIRKTEPAFRIALAGIYHASIADEIDDLCLGLGDRFPEGVVEARRAAGKISTFYTCCSEKYPNTFLASDPSEAAWLPWMALARGDDGYLRWAFNSWTTNPMKDARFRTWPAGDCYMVYPGGLSSVRFERLREGLQDYFKAVILMSEWGPGSRRTEALEKALSGFTVSEMETHGTARALESAREALEE